MPGVFVAPSAGETVDHFTLKLHQEAIKLGFRFMNNALVLLPKGLQRSSSLQVSCLGLEENVEGDPNKFILSSCSTNGTVESFVLHSSHPGVREVWTLQISQILDSQHNFLNGRSVHNIECFSTFF